MSKLAVTGINLLVEIADKNYGSGTASSINISAKTPVGGISLANGNELIDEGLSMYLTAIQTLMAGRLATELVTEEAYKSFLQTANARIVQLRQALKNPVAVPASAPPQPTYDAAEREAIKLEPPLNAPAVTPIPKALESTSAVSSAPATPTVQTVPAGTSAPFLTSTFVPLKESAKFSERLTHLEQWIYGSSLPRDSKRENQLVKYSLFLVPTAAKTDIEINGRWVPERWRTEMFKFTEEERRHRLALLEQFALGTTPEKFREWAGEYVLRLWGPLA